MSGERPSGRGGRAAPVLGAAVRRRVVGALIAVMVALPIGATAVPATAASADRPPSIGPGLEWVAHRDNPFRQGDSRDFINSDLAFTGDHLVQGNFGGFSMWDIADPANPQLASAVSCPGGQADVSAVGNLVVLSVDETMSDDSCQAVRVPETSDNWEGLRIFDVSDPRAPEYVASVRTRCGSHTHTVVPDPSSTERVFVYVSAYSRGASLNCTGRNPLQIVEIPLTAPQQSRVVAELDLFDADTAFGVEDRVSGGAKTKTTSGCHDITAYPAKALAVAACRGDGLLLSLADPLAPTVLSRVRDPNVAFWHSGIFSNDASQVVFQDELGDGFINTCSSAFGGERGADAVWSIAGSTLELQGYYKLPRAQSDLEKCVAHSGGLVPVPDRFVIAQAWLEGGVSIVDLTNPAAPTELTWFDRPDYGYSMPFTAGIWSVYFYDGYLYASDMYEGLEVLRLTDPAFADAARYPATSLNPQTQPELAWVWREAPVVPTESDEREALAELAVEIVASDAAAPATLTVSLPAGSLVAGEHVDLWWMTTASVVATATAAPDGSLPPTQVALPPGLPPGTYDIVARGDRSAPAFALGVVGISDGEPAGLAVTGGAADDGVPWPVTVGMALAILAFGAAAASVVLVVRRSRVRPGTKR